MSIEQQYRFILAVACAGTYYMTFDFVTWLIKKISRTHEHTFSVKDVMNLEIDPKCNCGVTLSEACREKGKSEYLSFNQQIKIK